MLAMTLSLGRAVSPTRWTENKSVLNYIEGQKRFILLGRVQLGSNAVLACDTEARPLFPPKAGGPPG